MNNGMRAGMWEKQMRLHRASILTVAVAGLLVFTGASQAQDTNTNKRAERRRVSVQQRVDRLTTELKLNEDQKAKMAALLQNQVKQRRELIADKNLSRDERREKMRAIGQDEKKELKTILTAEQLEKFKQLREQMRTRRQGEASRTGDTTPAPAPEPKNPESKSQ